MESEISVVVLAGGRSSRMGKDKALLPLGGRTLLEHVLDRVKPLTEDVVVVTRDPRRFQDLPARVVGDEPGPRGALTGLYSGLRATRNDLALAVACDMPFLNLRLIRYMALLAPGHDVVIPRVRGFLEPLHAFYRKSCLGPIREVLDRGEQKVIAFFPQVRVRVVEGWNLEVFDPAYRSFINVNTPEDWETVQRLFAGESEREVCASGE